MKNRKEPETHTHGGFPLWAFAQERAARAIDQSLELGLDLGDPFAAGWFETDEGPTARDFVRLS